MKPVLSRIVALEAVGAAALAVAAGVPAEVVAADAVPADLAAAADAANRAGRIRRRIKNQGDRWRVFRQENARPVPVVFSGRMLAENANLGTSFESRRPSPRPGTIQDGQAPR